MQKASAMTTTVDGKRVTTWGANAYTAMIAAAPQFVPPKVTDDVAQKVCELHFEYFWNKVGARSGRDMIAAVQQVLGPTLGLVPREWVEEAYHEGARDANSADRCMFDSDAEQYSWSNSDARKRIEGDGNG